MARERPKVPDHLPPPAELVDTDCRHSNALVDAIMRAVRANWGGCSDFEIVGALEYAKRWVMNDGATYRGYRELEEKENDDGLPQG